MIGSFFQEILDWSEVWALLIPLMVLSFSEKQPHFFKPIIVYLWLALIIDAVIDVGWKFEKCAPGWMHPNNYLYNVHSIIRFICFSLFFNLLKQPYHTRIKKMIPWLSLLFLIINFLFLEKFYEPQTISSRLFAVEAGLLLFYCLQYYLFRMKEEDVSISERSADNWVVTGLSIYVVFNFFYFLFYTTLLNNGYTSFVVAMWNYHNISFVILCIFIARAFYAVGHK
jgi:hypothetical protein